MIELSFLLIGEGSSDVQLVAHLKELCTRCGADEVTGSAPDLRLLPEVGHSLNDKLSAALRWEPDVDLVFIHRDADGPDPAPRRAEIQRVAREMERDLPAIPLVPVRATEAWLLVDEAEIRRAAGNPNGRVQLDIPSPTDAETVSDPKQLLFDLLRAASELSGRRLQRFERDLHRRRTNLLQNLRCEGPVSQVPAWRRLEADLSRAIDRLAGSGSKST